MTGIEDFATNEEMRDSVVSITNSTALCSAILCGVSITAFLAIPTIETGEVLRESLLNEFVDPQWGRRWAPGLMLASSFFSLQTLMTSMVVSSYAKAIPLERMAEYVKTHRFELGMCGWMMGPSLATLSMGLVCLTEEWFPQTAPVSLLMLFCLGATNFYQTQKFLRTSYRLRKKVLKKN